MFSSSLKLGLRNTNTYEAKRSNAYEAKRSYVFSSSSNLGLRNIDLRGTPLLIVTYLCGLVANLIYFDVHNKGYHAVSSILADIKSNRPLF